MLKNYVLYSIFFLFNFHIAAQVYDFQRIDQEDGLPSSSINAVFQDSRDYLWIGTDGGGLVKYDGLNYQIFDRNKGLPGEFVTDIVEDSNTNIVIATRFSGIYVYDGLHFAKKFDQNAKILSTNFIFKLLNTNQGIVGVNHNELFVITSDYKIKILSKFLTPFNLVTSIVEKSSNEFLLGTDKGLFLVTKSGVAAYKPNVIDGKVTVCKDSKNTIFIGTDKSELFTLTKNVLSEPEFIKSPEGSPFSIKNIYVTKRGSKWLSSYDSNAICLYNRPNSYVFFDITNGFDGENSNSFYQDNNKNLYIATSSSGLFVTAPQQFISFSNIDFLSGSSIFSIAKNKDRLYVSNNKKEILEVLFNQTDKIQLLKKHPFENAFASFVNNQGETIFGNTNGLVLFDDNSLKKINLRHLVNNENLKIISISQDTKGDYLIGTFGHGLLILDKNFKFIKQLKRKGKVFSDFISTILQIDKNQWYIGTSDGLFLVKKKNDKFYFSKKIISDVISVGTVDSYGNFWFSGNKKLHVVTKELKKIFYTEKSGLLSTLIYTLIANNDGDLLIGTNFGLAKVKINENGKLVYISNYNSKNGFNGLETNMRAQFKDKNGQIYLATLKGLFQCLGNYRTIQTENVKVKITGIRLFNDIIDWRNKKQKNNWSNLPPENFVFENEQDDITFDYLSINSKVTKNALYSYKLDGLENATWSKPSEQRSVNYSNLNFGKFVFHVRVVDNIGNPISDVATYSFRIQKPFYFSWWFIISAIGILYAIIAIIFNRTSKYNKDFVKNYHESDATNEQFGLYFLFLGILIPLIDFVIEISGVRAVDTLQFNVLTGLGLISIYLISKKVKIVHNNLRLLFALFLLMYVIETIRKMILFPDKIASFLDFLVAFFLSYTLFKSIKSYWFYVFLIFGLIIALYTSNAISREVMVAFLYSCFIIAILNHVRHIVTLNSKDKFLFADNIVNKGTSLVLAVNKDGEVVYCSESITTILGYTSEEVKGINYWRLTEDKEFYKDNYDISEALYIRRLKCKDGSYKYIQWKDSKFSDDLYVGIGQDVTEQVEVQNQYQKLIESASDMIYETNLEGYITYINNFSEKLLGYTKKETLGKHFTLFIRPDYVSEVETFYKTTSLNTDEIPYIEFPIIKKDGQELWISQKVSLSFNVDGKVMGYAAIARDVTLLKNIEREQKERFEKNEIFSQTINKLVTKRYSHKDVFLDIIKHIIKTAAQGTKIDRISYWAYNKTSLECISLYNLDNNTFDGNIVTHLSECPIYFSTLERDKIIIASNVYDSHSTQEFISDYLPKNNIKSMLDVPIIINGEIDALLCLETTKKIRNWDNDDINFARSVSDVLSIAIESHKRLETEKKLESKTEILSAIAASTQKLLKSNNLSEIFTDIFSIVGKATKIDRIYYFENDPVSKTLSQKSEWSNRNITPQIKNPKLQNISYKDSDEFLVKLLQNKVFMANINEITNPIIKKRWADQDILSILIFPIFVKNQFYGSIGFDDCTQGRNWSDDEIGVLQILANNIATAIERIQNEMLLQESEQRFKLLANNIPGTVYLSEYDDNWTKVFLNDEIEKLTGYQKSDFLQKKINLIDLVHPGDRQHLKEYTKEAIEKGESFHVIYRLKRKNDEYIWVEEFGDIILKDNKITYIEGILIDITAKKEIESEIKARELAEASSKAKSDFLANMSHEIRTPLNAIVGFSSILKETSLDATQLEYLATVNQSADILLDVVNDILDFSKIETGKLELEYQKINLYELAHQIIDIIRFDSEQKNIELVFKISKEVPKFVFIDGLRIKQVLLNLLSNAVKFTNKGSVQLHIDLLSKTKTTAKIKVSVLDTGIGIKKENLQKIFEPFSQEDNSTTRKYGGTGLGLAISNNILKLMKSKLELTSNLGKGSKFYFEIDLEYYDDQSEVSNFADVKDINVEYEDVTQHHKKIIFGVTKKILVVEDNRINMLLTKTLIKKIMDNAQIFEAENGMLGAEACKEHHPDLILLDIQMPVLNGYEAAQLIRKFDTKVPIVALTAGTIKGEREKCIESGMNDYISKPIDKDLFESMLLKWLQ